MAGGNLADSVSTVDLLAHLVHHLENFRNGGHSAVVGPLIMSGSSRDFEINGAEPFANLPFLCYVFCL